MSFLGASKRTTDGVMRVCGAELACQVAPLESRNYRIPANSGNYRTAGAVESRSNVKPLRVSALPGGSLLAGSIEIPANSDFLTAVESQISFCSAVRWEMKFPANRHVLTE